jgi:hypothetical protein
MAFESLEITIPRAGNNIKFACAERILAASDRYPRINTIEVR